MTGVLKGLFVNFFLLLFKEKKARARVCQCVAVAVFCLFCVCLLFVVFVVAFVVIYRLHSGLCLKADQCLTIPHFLYVYITSTLQASKQQCLRAHGKGIVQL